MNTTLNEIKKHRPCIDGWKKLLASLGKTQADDEPLSFKHILENNGIKDAVWALRVLPLKDQALFRADVAEFVLHLFESKYPHDVRPRQAIVAMRLFAHGKISEDDLSKASFAACYAANATDYATNATAYAADASAYAAYAAANVAHTSSVAVDYLICCVGFYKWQEIERLFIKHFCEE